MLNYKIYNETGTIFPVKAIAEIAHARGAFFHTDAVQAAGHLKLDVEELNVDMLSVSAHKFHGPKGVGFLYCKRSVILRTLIEGGAQERGERALEEHSLLSPAVCLHLFPLALGSSPLNNC